jgi:hypothetical protein
MKLDAVRRGARLPLKKIEEADAAHFDRDRNRFELACRRQLRVKDASGGGDIRTEDTAVRTTGRRDRGDDRPALFIRENEMVVTVVVRLECDQCGGHGVNRFLDRGNPVRLRQRARSGDAAQVGDRRRNHLPAHERRVGIRGRLHRPAVDSALGVQRHRRQQGEGAEDQPGMVHRYGRHDPDRNVAAPTFRRDLRP